MARSPKAKRAWVGVTAGSDVSPGFGEPVQRIEKHEQGLALAMKSRVGIQQQAVAPRHHHRGAGHRRSDQLVVEQPVGAVGDVPQVVELLVLVRAHRKVGVGPSLDSLDETQQGIRGNVCHRGAIVQRFASGHSLGRLKGLKTAQKRAGWAG
ncbi:MAG TPA: hypothetical protein PK954_06815, partial [Anaerolineales bacterium]|nr:hypothetical protein [Anaerolineales bacterium]